MNRFLRSIILTVLLIPIAPGCASSTTAVRSADTFHDSFTSGAVAADHAVASEAGARMLAMGGNAVDAAVAASFTLSVVRPYSCGIGGGGFMVIHLPDDPTHGFVHTAINYRETSPYHAEFFSTGLSMTNGRHSVAIPGTVAGLLYALETYGTLDRETVIGPAIEAATEGFLVDDHYIGAAERLHEMYIDNPGLQTGHTRMPWERFAFWGQIRLGDRIRNPEQARALRLIAEQGLDAFTRGEIGEAIVRSLSSSGSAFHRSPISVDDLAAYEPVETEPIEATIAGRRFIGMPPPSSGGVTMFETLRIMEATGYDFASGPISSGRAHTMIESLKHAFADRARYLADPRFTAVPIERLLSDENIERIASSLTPRAGPLADYGTHLPPNDDAGTSHISVIDPFGGAVACTETINFEFGSRVGVEEFGFILNNEMDDFTHPNERPNGFGLVQSVSNLPEPGKRPLSSMSPTIVLDQDGRVLAVAGASGGPRIITSTMQTLLNVLAGMDAGQAVAMPRLHHQWLPDELSFEAGYSKYVLNVLGNPLRNYGHTIVDREATVGNVQLIVRDPEGHGWQAASDPRKGGRPAGID
ncbi:MAG: gamma-glutamyltransferase [Phycisphaerales bacterium]